MNLSPLLEYYIGLDLARARDYSAFAVIAARSEPFGKFDHARYEQHYRTALLLGALKRVTLGTEYCEIVEKLRRLVQTLRARVPFGHPEPTIHVVFDAAGPGHVVFELLRAANLNVFLVPVVMTAGTEVGHSSGRTTVPRRNLVSNMRYLLETELLRIHGTLSATQILLREFVAVRPHGGQYPHDDLAIAVSLAAWRAARVNRDLLHAPIAP